MLFRLISLSTTTGWLDWEHGELWISSGGLLRRRRGWLATASGDGLDPEHMRGASLPDVHQEFSGPDIEAITKEGGLWIAAEQVKSASLRRGIITGRARLGLMDGSSVKLLWARSAQTFEALKETIAPWVAGEPTLD